MFPPLYKEPCLNNFNRDFNITIQIIELIKYQHSEKPRSFTYCIITAFEWETCSSEFNGVTTKLLH